VAVYAETLEWLGPDGSVTLLQQRLGARGRFAPPIKLVTDQISGVHGSRVRTVRADAANIVVPVLLSTALTNPDGFRTLVRQLASALNPLRGSGMLRSTVTHTSGVVEVRLMVAYYVDGMNFTEDDTTTGYPSLLFQSDGPPFWTDDADTSLLFTNQATSYTWFPIGGAPWAPLVLNASSIFATATVVNTGDAEAWPVWTITGPVSGLIQFDNLTTAKSLWLDYAIGSGQTNVVLNTRPGLKSATQGATSLYGYLTSWDMWPLAPGSNNIQITVPGATASTRVQCAYLRAFLAA
jgi:hypothetical protein